MFFAEFSDVVFGWSQTIDIEIHQGFDENTFEKSIRGSQLVLIGDLFWW